MTDQVSQHLIENSAHFWMRELTSEHRDNQTQEFLFTHINLKKKCLIWTSSVIYASHEAFPIRDLDVKKHKLTLPKYIF